MKEKHLALTIMILIFSILAVGCSGKIAGTVTASDEVSTATRLAVGTLKLEGTSQAVTASQAKELLTLWEAYQSMSSSDTSAQVEVEALVSQINGSMTAEQIKAIDAMNLTQAAVVEMEQSAMVNSAVSAVSTPAASSSGVANSNPVNSGTSGSAPSGANQAAPAGGPSGGMPVSGSNPLAEITGGTAAQSTPSATQSTSSSTQVNPMILEELIQLLQSKSQTAG